MKPCIAATRATIMNNNKTNKKVRRLSYLVCSPLSVLLFIRLIRSAKTSPITFLLGRPVTCEVSLTLNSLTADGRLIDLVKGFLASIYKSFTQAQLCLLLDRIVSRSQTLYLVSLHEGVCQMSKIDITTIHRLCG